MKLTSLQHILSILSSKLCARRGVSAFLLLSLLSPTFSKAVESDDPIEIEADEFYYDKSNELVYGEGNVVITQQGQVIVADKIKYERTSEEIYAIGNVGMRRLDGSVYFGDQVKLNRLNDTGAVLNFKARIGAQGAMAANFAEMYDRQHLSADEVVYSPCEICESNAVPNTPLWQFRAKHVDLDREEDKMRYDHATLEAFGFPIFYTPYLVTPAPGAQRKSGFLTPRLYWSGIFGNGVRIPFYINIARNMDATVAARFNSNLGNVYDAEFRHKLRNGDYKLITSITHTDKYDKTGRLVPGKKEIRAHYDLKGRYYFDNQSFPIQLTVDSKRLMDPNKTYLKKYGFGNEDVLKTDVAFTNITNKRYAAVRALFFQDLRPDSRTKTTASALPQGTFISHHTFSNMKIDGQILADYTNLNRPQGMSYNRFVLKPSLSKSVVTPNGFVLSGDASVRSDFYNVDYNPVKVASNYTPNAQRQGSEARAHPEFVATANYPLYNTWNGNFIIIDPVVQGVFSPKESNLKLVDNEDSQAPEIGASNLFTPNRYKGYDLLESGNRLNYGMRANVKSKYFKNLSAILGQSYRFSKDSNFDKASGMQGHSSDYVGSITLQPDKYWVITEGARFDTKDGQLNRNEFGVTYSYSKFSATLYHFQINKRLLDPSKQNMYKQEVQLAASYNFHRHWFLEGFVKSKIGKKNPSQTTPMISNGLAIKNKNECLQTELSVSRDYTHLKDLQPATSYVLKVSIPTF